MKNYSPWSWIALFAGLFALQAWLVPMVIHAVTGTEWLRGTPEQGGDSRPVTNENTAAAFAHCNHYLRTTQAAKRFEFPSTADRSWDLGFDRYMIQASVQSDDPSAGAHRVTYLCRIHHTGGDLADFTHWTVAGFELTSR